jgi:hypothetical protein
VALTCNEKLRSPSASNTPSTKRLTSRHRRSQATTSCLHASATAKQADLAQSRKRDEQPPIGTISDADRRCAEQVRDNAQRTSEGQPIVDLPCNDRPPSFGTSEPTAMKRIASPERRAQIMTHARNASTMVYQADRAQSPEIDELRPIKNISDADQSCEEAVRVHVQRHSEERSTVAFPCNDSLPSLGSSEPLVIERIASSNRRSQTATNPLHASTTADQAELAQSWKIDEQPPTENISDAERPGDEHVRAHDQHNSEERSIVALPCNERLSSLGASNAPSTKRLASLNRRSQTATSCLHASTTAQQAELA